MLESNRQLSRKDRVRVLGHAHQAISDSIAVLSDEELLRLVNQVDGNHRRAASYCLEAASIAVDTP
jgi:hypothetical protein